MRVRPTQFHSVLLCLLFVAAVPLFPQDAKAGYSVKGSEKNAGRLPREYEVRYSVDPGSLVTGIGVTNVDFSKVSILLEAVSTEQNTVLVRIQSFELSNFTIPSLPISVQSGGRTSTVMTPEVPVEQQPMTAAVSNIAPIEEIYPISDRTVLILALLAVLLLGVSGLLVYRVFFMKKKDPVLLEEKVDPYEEALMNLNHLKYSQWDENNMKMFYQWIWEIVRRFLGRVFDFPAPEMSTTEIAAFFRKVQDDSLDEVHDRALHVLKISERVKYAKFMPGGGQVEVVLNESFELVRRVREHFDALKPAAEGTDLGAST